MILSILIYIERKKRFASSIIAHRSNDDYDMYKREEKEKKCCRHFVVVVVVFEFYRGENKVGFLEPYFDNENQGKHLFSI